MQSRKMSFIESLVNTVVGTVIGFCVLYYIAPLVGMCPSVEQSLLLNLFFIFSSNIRSYMVRRGFVWLEVWLKYKRGVQS